MDVSAAANVINQQALNPFIASGQFDLKQLNFPVAPENIEFEGLPDEAEILDLYQYLDEVGQRDLDMLLAHAPQPPLLHQIIPFWRDDWEVMALNGGRGVGKTITGAKGVMEVIEGQGPKARIGIGAPTNSDVRDYCFEGETGLITLYGNEFKYYNRSLGQIEARHKNGAYVRGMGTEKPRKWNGPQWSWLWFDEYSLCNPKAIEDALLGLRLGPKDGPFRARMLATMTPKGQAWVEELLRQSDTYVPHYIGPDGKPRFPTTFDNPYLPQRRVDKLRKQFAGTRLGLQELLGLFIGDVAGAKWNRQIIHHVTDDELWPKFTRIVVAIDPAGTSARKKADENAATEDDRRNQRRRASTSICVAAKGTDGKIYILAWIAGQWSPNTWATKAFELFKMFRADRFVAERNYGGDMVESTLRNVWRDAPITTVVATRGKEQRAEPVVALYEQGRVEHCFVFAEAEHQLCSFVNSSENDGADYVDSGVWAIWELMGWQMLGDLMHVVGQNEALQSFHVIK